MKVLWAVEPFQQDASRNKSMFKILTQLSGGSKNVDAGFVVTKAEPELNLAFDIPEKDRFTTYPRQIIKKSFKQSGVTLTDQHIHIAQSPTLSTTKAVDALLKLASSRKADLIALFTHSRKGVARFFLGSFTETTIHRSQTSLLVVNPTSKLAPTIKHVFFSSDFSQESLRQLRDVLEICSSIGATLTVFHSAEPMYKWALNEEDKSVIRYRRSVDAMKEKILAEGKNVNIAIKVVIKSELRPISEMALKTAAKVGADLLVVTAKTGRFAALMCGSVTRQIIRQSVKPVLVLK